MDTSAVERDAEILLAYVDQAEVPPEVVLAARRIVHDRLAHEAKRASLKRMAVGHCTDHGCVFGHPGGQGTNAGCRCLDGLKGLRRVYVREAIKAVR